MSAEPLARPQLLTVAEYLAIGEVEPGYTELVEGRVSWVPSPYAEHNSAAFEIAFQLRPRLSPQLEVILDIDVDLLLAPQDDPGFVRRTDFIVVDRAARQHQRRHGSITRAADVVVIVIGEIISPGSKRTDYIDKRREYADSRIPHYWIIGLRQPVSILPCRLTAELGYTSDGEVTGTFTTAHPFPLTIELDTLL